MHGAVPCSVKAGVDQLVGERRAFLAQFAGEVRTCAAEDAGRRRDALGVNVPLGLPRACTESVEAPVTDLVARYARTHGPFLAAHAAARYGVAPAPVLAALEALEVDGRLVRGAFRPDGVAREWCDSDVLPARRIRCMASGPREGQAGAATTYNGRNPR